MSSEQETNKEKKAAGLSKIMMVSRPLRLSSQSTQREHFLFGGEIPPNKKVSALLKSLLAESQRILRRIGTSPILLKEILLRDLCALCERRSVFWLRLSRTVASVRDKILSIAPSLGWGCAALRHRQLRGKHFISDKIGFLWRHHPGR